jgi:hypothetical protein
MDAEDSSERPITIYLLTQGHTPEGLTLHQHFCGNVKQPTDDKLLSFQDHDLVGIDVYSAHGGCKDFLY